MTTQYLGLKQASAAFVLAACVCVPQTAEALCITYRPPSGGVRLWATGGSYGFKELTKPGEDLPTGRLFRLSPAGQEQIVWERTLVDLPKQVLFSPDLKTVVTVGGGCNTDEKHALVLYGPDGRVVADLTFYDIVPLKQSAGKVTVSSVGIHWADGTRFAFENDSSLRNHFVITFPGGSQSRIDYTTGKVVGGESLEVKP
jgi:hypothetical protein